MEVNDQFSPVYKAESGSQFEEFFSEGRAGVSPASGIPSALQLVANLNRRFCSRRVRVCAHVCIQ